MGSSRFVAAVGLVALVSAPVGFPAQLRASRVQGAAPSAPLNSPVGNWSDTVAYCNVGWCKGQSFPNPTIITSYSPATGAFHGTDAGTFTVDGFLHGNALTMVTKESGYTSWSQGTITFGPTKATWGGTWHDSHNVGGTWKGSRKAVELTLSGLVTGQTCSPTSCSSAGLPGQTIVVVGTASDGSAVKKSALTDASGAWSAPVPKGAYTVGPSSDGQTIDGTDFDPQQRQVTADSADIPNLDFVTCVASASSGQSTAGQSATSGAALRAAAAPNGGLGDAASLPHAASSLVCPPDHVDWKMLLHSVGDVPRDAGSDPLGMLPNNDIYRPLVARLFLTRYGQPFTQCTKKTEWRWTITPITKGVKVLKDVSDKFVGCALTIVINKSATFRVEVNEYLPGKSKPLHKKPIRQNVNPKDLLVASMGDSNGSGEGYPPFYFDQCHRGVASYQYQAANMLEQQAKGHVTVTFVSASCSGARIQHLVDTIYAGIVPGTGLAPQIDELVRRLAPPSGTAPRTPDATLISIGVNNIAFGPLLQYCTKYVLSKAADDASRAAQEGPLPKDPLPWRYCQDTPVSATPDGTGGVATFTLVAHSAKTLGGSIDTLIADLPRQYAKLAAKLGQSGIFKSQDVYLSQYPEFWYASPTSVCGGQPSSPFPKATWAWLGTEGNKLNAAVAAAAAAHGWRTITVPASAFYDHGYCSFTSSWFVPLTLGIRYNVAGSFHPTGRGAHVTGVQALRLLCPLLGDKALCTSFPDL